MFYKKKILPIPLQSMLIVNPNLEKYERFSAQHREVGVGGRFTRLGYAADVELLRSAHDSTNFQMTSTFNQQ